MAAYKASGFTLFEVLIALAILGLIATFGIPKVLKSTYGSKNTAIFKESVATLSSAYSAYEKINGMGYGVSGTRGAEIVIAHVNIVRTITSGSSGGGLSVGSGLTSFNCSSTEPCYELHNGAWIQAGNAGTQGFLGNDTKSNAIQFNLDPDGERQAAGAVTLYMFYGGRVVTYSDIGAPPSGLGSGGLASVEAIDPDWATWLAYAH